MEAKEILLADLEHVRRLLLSSEEGGQVRVSFLLSFVTAVCAGLIALHTSDVALRDKPPPWIDDITLGALAFLLMMSAVVYLRILRRNSRTDHYRSMTKAIFQKLRQISVEIDEIGYDPKWAPEENVVMRYLRGGYAHMVALIVGFLVVALVNLFTSVGLQSSVVFGAVVFGFLYVIPTLLRPKYDGSSPYAV